MANPTIKIAVRWRPFGLCLLAALIAALVGSCASPHPARPVSDADSDWKLIGDVDGLDSITQMHVAHLLESHQIEAYFEGSVAYGLFVRKQDAARSLAIIRDDLREHHYPISLSDSEIYSIQNAEWKSVRLQQKYSDLIQLEPYRQDTDLGGVLRQPTVVEAVRAFPYVDRIESLERQYMDSPGRMLAGHDVRVELVVRPDKEIGGARFFFQVWDDGREVQGHGSNEWWAGDPEAVSANQKQYDHRQK